MRLDRRYGAGLTAVLAVKHPARYSKALLPTLFEWTAGSRRILDPMAGVGSARFGPGMVCNELEPEWAAQCPGPVTVGDATALPYRDGAFDCVVTSPTYGNRMADHHDAKDTSRRNTYTHVLGRKLTAGNTGQMQWGPEYRALHLLIWLECQRVLRPGGRLIVNVSNHIRKGVEVDVSQWHQEALMALGLSLLAVRTVDTPRNRMGANGNVRVAHENLLLLRKPA